jgi:hypothetical protein
MNDLISWHADVRVDKYTTEQLDWLKAKYDWSMTEIDKLSGDRLRELLGGPDEVTRASGNLLTYVGLAYLLAALTGVSTTTTAVQLSSGHIPVAVGDGGGTVPAASVVDSDLAASTNKYYMPVDGTYPAVGLAGASAGSLTVNATFASGVANFAWNEWGLYGATTAFTSGQTTKPATSTMINHRGVYLGTKVVTNIWTLAATISLS